MSDMNGAHRQEATGPAPSGLSQSPLSQAEPLVPCAYGEPITTVAELDSLDSDEVVEGYWDGRRNEPEPTGNRSKSYWHGWRNGMSDAGHREIDAAQRRLAHEVVEHGRKQSEGSVA